MCGQSGVHFKFGGNSGEVTTSAGISRVFGFLGHYWAFVGFSPGMLQAIGFLFGSMWVSCGAPCELRVFSRAILSARFYPV